jgi:hypothetical protein
MPFPPRPVDATLHGITDYAAAGTLLTLFPRLANLEGTESARQVRIAGAIHGGYSTLTDYPLGLVKLIPYRVHLALDAVGALGLAATPFLTGQWRRGRRHWVPQVALCAFELSALLMSDPSGAGDFHGDIEAVRAANQEIPHRKIHDGPPAVEPGTARPSHPPRAREAITQP